MRALLPFVLLNVLTNTRTESALDPDKNDFRFISYQDLQTSFDKFSQKSVTTYSQLLFDVSRNQVLVGARDTLYRLSLPHLHLLENATWTSPDEKIQICLTKGQSEENCHNYIKILLTNGKRIFACGTNAFSPLCSWREIENLNRVIDWVDGVAKCPYNPVANISALMTDTGEYYVGGPTDFSGSDFAIYRSMSNLDIIRTKQYNSMWLNEPQFVATFETDKFIYFLFREAAVEYINCGKIVYSRIARMCKSDNGGKVMLIDNWTTFLKARLNCSINGEYPFYFDEIQSASYIPEEGLVYATFSTPVNSIAGSAICAFNLTAIDRSFSGPFKYQEDTGSTWDKHYSQYQDHFECKASVHSNNLIESSKYQLMDTAVQATTLRPLHVAELQRYTHLTIDVLATKLHAFVHVIYVATTEGLIKKITVLPRTQETCVVEIWQPVADARIPIQSLQYLKDTNSVYVGTKNELLRISADHCRRHVSKESCMNAMDPYCGWNEYDEACTTAPLSDPLTPYWDQSVTTCPILDARIDGGWSTWSEWSSCIHGNPAESDFYDECLCQVRRCNNPAPRNGGSACVGPSIAVTNCTIHGGWTAWSAWSECSATCGIAVKTRTRTCTNPAPAHGGRVCVGQDRSEVLCTGNPPCPVPSLPPQDGGWGEWETWEPCSAICGGGFRKRYRRCNNPLPARGGLECAGSHVDFEMCNMELCMEQKKVAPWTPWFITNKTNSKNEPIQRRFKYICRGPVQSAQQLKISIHKEEDRACQDGLCAIVSNTNSGWSPWSPWSGCSATCGTGRHTRTRFCERNGPCQGPSTQTKECNIRPCESKWNCWNDWSPCSVSCGWGIKKRFRACSGDMCEGHSYEEEACEQPPCESLLGWGKWTAWSLCDEKKLQYRSRVCKATNPSPNMCKGDSEESRMCIYNPDMPNDLYSQSGTTSASFGLVIGYVIVGFVICLVCSVIFFYYYVKKKRNRIPSSPHYINAKPNSYISVPLKERSNKKQCPSTSNSILNNINGTLKLSKCNDYESSTIKRNSHGLNNGLTKTDKAYYE